MWRELSINKSEIQKPKKPKPRYSKAVISNQMCQSEQSKCHFNIKIIMLDKILQSGQVKHPTKAHLASGVGGAPTYYSAKLFSNCFRNAKK